MQLIGHNLQAKIINSFNVYLSVYNEQLKAFYTAQSRNGVGHFCF